MRGLFRHWELVSVWVCQKTFDKTAELAASFWQAHRILKWLTNAIRWENETRWNTQWVASFTSGGMASPKSSPSSPAKRGTKFGGKSPTRKSHAGEPEWVGFIVIYTHIYIYIIQRLFFVPVSGPKLAVTTTDFVPEGDDKNAPPAERSEMTALQN